MLKQAYQLGVAMAYEDAGMTKEAFGGKLVSGLKGIGKTLTEGISANPAGEKAMQWVMKNPLAAHMGAGAGIGGLGGAMFGDEGGMMRGALMGAGVGAGLHGGRLMGMGKGGRAARELLRSGPKRTLLQRSAKSRLEGLASKSALGAGAGALGAGVLGYGLSGAMVPGRDYAPPWYRRYS